MARGTGCILVHNMLPVFSEAAVGQYAVLQIVTLVAQRVIGECVCHSGSIAAGRHRRWLQGIISFQNVRQVGSVWAAGAIACVPQVPSAIAVMAIGAVD